MVGESVRGGERRLGKIDKDKGCFFGRPSVPAHLAIVNPNTGRSEMDDSNQTLLDPNNMPKLTIEAKDKSERLVLQPSSDGTLDAKLHLGRTFQPCVGIGYGYALPKGRVTFMFDAGVRFKGKAVISSPNTIEGDPNVVFILIDNDNISQIRYYTQIFPVINMGIAIRIY